MKKLFLSALLILIQIAGFSQTLTIDFPEYRFRIDPYNHIIVVQSQNIEVYTNLSEYEEINLNLTEFHFHFEEIPDNLEYTGMYSVNDGNSDYNLFFTQLPLLKIQSQGNIPNSYKIPAQFLYADNDQVVDATIGIEIRGGVSQGYPKKNYGIEFWEDAESETPVNVQLGNLRNDDDWILDGMYNEPLRIRSHTTSKLWLDMHQPYYQSLEQEARSGAGDYYVELFLNGRYSGIYQLSERVDRKLLKIKQFSAVIRGEIYKGKQWGDAVSFVSLHPFNNGNRYWGGYEMKYPKEADTTNWQNLYDFTDFVLNSSDIEFEGIWSKFNYQNYLDYFIFLNLIRATDNTGKNIFLVKYDIGSPYFYVPWDLDGVFGTIWDGTNANITNDILTNGFMNRVISTDVGNYTEDVDARWAELRESILSVDQLTERFESSYDLLKANNIYTREAMVYPNYPFDQDSFDYMVDWIENRMAFLDIYFNYHPDGIQELSSKEWAVYPNPVYENFNIRTSIGFKNMPFQIFDLQGKLIKSDIYSGQNISVSGMKQGFYIFRMGNLSEKIVVN